MKNSAQSHKAIFDIQNNADAVIEIYARAIDLAMRDLHSYQLKIDKIVAPTEREKKIWAARYRKELDECWSFMYCSAIQQLFEFDPKKLVLKLFEQKGWEYGEEIENSYRRTEAKRRAKENSNKKN